jgi:hypothetical protein
MAWTAPSTFVAGAILTAAQLNTNVRDNSLAGGPIYATTVARDAAITAPFVGQRAFISGTLINTVYNGTAWVDAGTVGAWTAWTATFTGATLVTTTFARYMQSGKSVTWQATFTSGAGVSSGQYGVNLPVTPRTTGFQSAGGGWFFAGGGWGALGCDVVAPSSIRFISAGGPMSNTVNAFTGGGQIIAVGGTYEAA